MARAGDQSNSSTGRAGPKCCASPVVVDNRRVRSNLQLGVVEPISLRVLGSMWFTITLWDHDDLDSRHVPRVPASRSIVPLTWKP